MSKLKKALSVVLCLSMLTGTISLLKLNAPVASAAEPTSCVKSYAELCEQLDYTDQTPGDTITSGKGFVYFAADLYEYDENNNLVLSDGYVDAGSKVIMRSYIKSNVYISFPTMFVVCDNDFFDVNAGYGGKLTAAANSPLVPVNSEHPVMAQRIPESLTSTYNYSYNAEDATACKFTPLNLSQMNLTAAEASSWGMVYYYFYYNGYTSPTYDSTITEAGYVELYKSDDYLYDLTFQVRTAEELAANGVTEGDIFIEPRMWTAYDTGETTKASRRQCSFKPSYFPIEGTKTKVDNMTDTNGDSVVTLGTDGFFIDIKDPTATGEVKFPGHVHTMLFSDYAKTVHVGQPPEPDEPEIPAPTSCIKSYAELCEQLDYTDQTPGDTITSGKGFVYFAADLYEYDENNNLVLSDGYVDAGSKVIMRSYIKSNVYISFPTMFVVCDNDFFDVNAGYGGKLTAASNSPLVPVNSEHPVMAQRIPESLTSTYNYSYNAEDATACKFTPLNLSQMNLTAAEASSWGMVYYYFYYNGYTSPTYDSTITEAGYVELYKSDDYLYDLTFQVRTAEELAANGVTEGDIFIEPRMWTAYDTGETTKASRRQCSFKPSYFPIEGTKTKVDNMTDTNGDSVVTLGTDGFFIDIKDPTATGEVKFPGHVHTMLFSDYAKTVRIGQAPSASTVKITYMNGADVAGTQNLEPGSSITPPTVSKTGATFIGWALPNGTIIDVATYKVGKSNTTLTAVWSDSTYPITFKANGGTFSGGSTDNVVIQVAANAAINAPSAPTNPGYIFDGWFDSKGNALPATLPNAAAATYSAKWTAATYDVNFYANRGDTVPCLTVTATYKKDLVLTTDQLPTKDGFALEGWYNVDNDEAVGVGARKTLIIAKPYEYTTGINLYAKWTQQSSITFYAPNYASTGADDQWVKVKTLSGDPGATATNSAVASVYTTLNKDLTVLGLDEGVAFGSRGANKPKWFSDPAYTNLVCDAATGSMEFPTDEQNIDVYLKAYLKANITWYVPTYNEAAGDYSGAYSELANSNDGVPAALLPVLEGDTKVIENPSYEYGTLNNGFKFIGWSTTPGSTTIDSSNYRVPTASTAGKTSSLFTYPGGNVNYYAVIVPVTYTLNFRVNNSQVITITDIPFGSQVSFDDINGPTIGEDGVDFDKEGYTFNGWYHKKYSPSTLIDFPLTLDLNRPEVVNAEYPSGIFSFSTNKIIYYEASWTAEMQPVVFIYKDADGNEQKYQTTAPTGTRYQDILAEHPEITSSAPVGYYLLSWTFSDPDTATNGIVISGGRTYTAKYMTRNGSVTYIYTTDEEGNPTRTNTVWMPYGSSLEDVLSNEKTQFSWILWPAGYIFAGWEKVSGEPLPDGTLGLDPIVYKAVYKPHTDYLIRIYNTGGNPIYNDGNRYDDNLYMTIEKKTLKVQYWKKGEMVDKSETTINPMAATAFIIYFKLGLEGFDKENFFNVDMWKNVSLYLEPIVLPKSALTWEGFKGIIQMIINLIKGAL